MHLKHQVGKTNLLEMPVGLDTLTKHKRRALRDNSIKFDKFAMTNRVERKEKISTTLAVPIEKIEEERLRAAAEAAYIVAQNSRDILKSFKKLGHTVKTINSVNMRRNEVIKSRNEGY